MPGSANNSVLKEFTTKGVIDREKRQVRFLASSPDIDRDHERILAMAWDANLGPFLKNGVVLCSHQHQLADGTPPVVGRAVKVWTDAAGLWIVVEFAETELGEQYWQLYSTEFMRAVSVGFIPLEWRDEIIDGERVRTYMQVELIELSLCAVPSNRGALARSKANKVAFIEGKRQEREDEQILKAVREEYRQQGRDFDAECNEFCELLLGGDNLGGGEVPEKSEPNYGAKFKKQA